MADAVLSLASALQDQQISAQALLYARMAALLTPDAGDVWLLIGRVGFSEGNAQMALDAFDRVPKGSPYAWQARLSAAQALAQLGRKEEAESRLRAMATEEPKRTEALVALGDMLRQDEKFAEAADVYTQALSRIAVLTRPDWRHSLRPGHRSGAYRSLAASRGGVRAGSEARSRPALRPQLSGL